MHAAQLANNKSFLSSKWSTLAQSDDAPASLRPTLLATRPMKNSAAVDANDRRTPLPLMPALFAPFPVVVVMWGLVVVYVQLSPTETDAAAVLMLWAFLAAAVVVWVGLSGLCFLITDFLNAYGLLDPRRLTWTSVALVVVSSAVLALAIHGPKDVTFVGMLVGLACFAAVAFGSLFGFWWVLASQDLHD